MDGPASCKGVKRDNLLANYPYNSLMVFNVWVGWNYMVLVEYKQYGWSGSIKCGRIINNVGGV